MSTKNWTKKDKIACTIIFVVAILTFVIFLSTMTLSYFYDEHSPSEIIKAGKVEVRILTKNDNGTTNSTVGASIRFPDVITPNTVYNVADNYGLFVQVKNLSTSGSILVMVKLQSDYIDIIRPQSSNSYGSQYFVMGTGTDDPNTTEVENNCRYLFFMSEIVKGGIASLCTAWQVGNYNNKLKGSEIKYEITAYAVQAQGGAINALIDGGVDGWQYAPEIFVNKFVNNV